MHKYINAEEFNTYKFENAVIQYANVYGELGQIPLREFIKKLPAADVVEVVRCKDCKYNLGKLFDEYIKCENSLRADLTDNDFCSCGERRESE